MKCCVFATLFCYIPLQNNSPSLLTHWGQVTHICVSKQTIIGSDNGLSPGRRQAIIWTNAGIWLIGPWGINFSEISIGIQTFSFKKLNLKMSFAKWRPFCLGLNVVNPGVATAADCYIYRGVLVSVMKGTLAPPRIYFMAAAALTYGLNKVGVVLIWKQCNPYVCCVKNHFYLIGKYHFDRALWTWYSAIPLSCTNWQIYIGSISIFAYCSYTPLATMTTFLHFY